MKNTPLPRLEVIKAVERRSPQRIPLVRAKWWGEGFEEQHGDRLKRFDRYPEDVVSILIANPADAERMDLSWEWREDGAYDARIVIDKWEKLDEFIAKLPQPANDRQWEEIAPVIEQAGQEDRYVLFGWWHFFFEKPWELRGMENLFIDHLEHADQVHRLHRALCDVYQSYIRTACELFHPDGFWTSDDLGHQTGPMINPRTFRELLKPYYREVAGTVSSNQMHFWLHSCGDNTLLLDDLIDAGVDVFHPVQKHTMDEAKVAAAYGGRITFLSGIDVQHTLIEKEPDGVREEVRFLIDTFAGPEGGMCIGAGNGILPGTPLENIEAFLDEALVYGEMRIKDKGQRIKDKK